MEFWKNISIGKKLALIFAMGFTLFGVFLCIFALQMRDLVETSEHALDKSLHTVNMAAREVEHVLWTKNLAVISAGEAGAQLHFALDAAECPFGQWLTGPLRAELAGLAPGVEDMLARVEAPHNHLHANARRISELLRQGLRDEARDLTRDSLNYSTQVLEILHEVRLLLENMVAGDRYAYSAMISETRKFILLVLLIFLVTGGMAAMLLGRSLTQPLHSIAALASRVKNGELDLRLRLNRADEVGRIADTLDSMLDALNVKMREAQIRVRELTRMDALLHCVNQATAVLLLGEQVDFDASARSALRIVGQAAGVDRAYIWANKRGQDGRLYCDQLYEWAEGVAPVEGSALARDISYDDVLPGWAERFGQGRSINSPVRAMSANERAQLEPQGILSLLVVPITLDGQVWGFIGFDDCQRERRWSRQEEDILRTTGMFMAVAIRRNRLDCALRVAKERAEEAARAKSDFLARMSHEIRTPMNGILGVAHIALQENPAPDQREHLLKIQSAAASLLGVLSDVLDFSSLGAGGLALEKVDFSLRGLLREVMEATDPKARAKGVPLSCRVSRDLPETVAGDAPRLRQVLLCLLDNAVKFTERGGVCLEVEVCNAGSEPTLHFAVLDTGVGMSADAQAWLFQPFTQGDSSLTRQYGGTGLGLAICRQLVEMMRGHIAVESDPACGSVFSCTLPLMAVNAQDAETPAPPSLLEKLRGKRVLLVEDNEINQIVAQSILEEIGIAVTLAEDGAQAVRAVDEVEAAFDLVLMDIQMPVMDGLEAARRIRLLPGGAALPIVALTAHSLSSDYAKSLDAGMNDHIIKPVEPAHLYAVLARWVCS